VVRQGCCFSTHTCACHHGCSLQHTAAAPPQAHPHNTSGDHHTAAQENPKAAPLIAGCIDPTPRQVGNRSVTQTWACQHWHIGSQSALCGEHMAYKTSTCTWPPKMMHQGSRQLLAPAHSQIYSDSGCDFDAAKGLKARHLAGGSAKQSVGSPPCSFPNCSAHAPSQQVQHAQSSGPAGTAGQLAVAGPCHHPTHACLHIPSRRHNQGRKHTMRMHASGFAGTTEDGIFIN
jgi:hypothetical protein